MKYSYFPHFQQNLQHFNQSGGKMKNSFFGLYLKTLVATLILLGSVAYVTYKVWGNIDKATDVKNAVEERYSYIPSADEGISFLLAIDNDNTNHGIYMLIDSAPEHSEITISPIPWQLNGSSGIKNRTLDGFMEKGTARDILNSVNSSLGTDITKYLVIDSETLSEVCDTLGGTAFNIEEDVTYETESYYASVSAGYQHISGKMLVALLEDPENFGKNTDGLKNIASLTSAFIYGQDSKRIETMAKSVFEMLIKDADTNLTAEDYLMREDAIKYLFADLEKTVNVINADGTFDIIKDEFTPTDDYLSEIQKVFLSE